MTRPVSILLVVSAMLFSLTAVAGQVNADSQFNVKVIASSTGMPCEANCWERWQETSGRGVIMVEKNAAGDVVAAGRLSEPYFYDLYLSTDEALRKTIPTSSQLQRYGTVRAVDPRCQSGCAITVDFGNHRDVLLGLNSSGKITGVHAIDDGNIGYAQPFDDIVPGYDQCANNAANQPNCYHWAGSGAILGVPVSIIVVYDEFGQVVALLIRFGDGRWITIGDLDA